MEIRNEAKIQNRSEQENHWNGHWVAKLNHNWRCSLVNIRNLVEESRCDTQSVSHILPWGVAIYDIGLYDKAGIPVVQKVAFSATQIQSVHKIVSNRYETFYGDHNFKCDKVFTSVIHQLNAAKYVEAYQYSGGPEGNGTIAVALHDSTLEPSDIFTRNSCVSNYMKA